MALALAVDELSNGLSTPAIEEATETAPLVATEAAEEPTETAPLVTEENNATAPPIELNMYKFVLVKTRDTDKLMVTCHGHVRDKILVRTT